MPAQRMQIPIVGSQAVDKSVSVNNQATINLMTAIRGVGAKAPAVLETCPGLVDIGDAGDGPVRTGRLVSSSIRVAGTTPELFGVFGSRFVAITPAPSVVDIGGLTSSTGRVQIARGRQYIAFVDGANGWTYDGTTYAQITDLDFPGQAAAGAPTFIVYMDGFFIVNDALTDNFFISDVENPTVWNALDFEAASTAPDNALAIASSNSLLWILGDETAQAYYNSGNADFPYEGVLNATQEVGILAPHSIAESDDGIFYLATTPEGGRFIYQIKGQQGQVITGEEQEQFLSSLVSPEEAYGFIYKQAGKSFYVLQCGENTGYPDANDTSTLVYNIRAGTWETRTLSDGSAWRAGGAGVLNNENLVGSRLAGRYLRLDLDVYTDAGQPIIRTRRTQVIHNMGQEIDYWSLIVDVQPGVGNSSAPNPTLKMRYSNDAGQTWSNWLTESLGAAGQTGKRVSFDQLGRARNRVFELQLADACNLTIINAYADVELIAD